MGHCESLRVFRKSLGVWVAELCGIWRLQLRNVRFVWSEDEMRLGLANKPRKTPNWRENLTEISPARYESASRGPLRRLRATPSRSPFRPSVRLPEFSGDSHPPRSSFCWETTRDSNPGRGALPGGGCFTLLLPLISVNRSVALRSESN